VSLNNCVISLASFFLYAKNYKTINVKKTKSKSFSPTKAEYRHRHTTPERKTGHFHIQLKGNKENNKIVLKTLK
jgi:hypothetical protein